MSSFPTDSNYNPIHAPIAQTSVMSGTVFTVDSIKTVSFCANTTLTIDSGATVNILQGQQFIFVPDVTYNFGTSVRLVIS